MGARVVIAGFQHETNTFAPLTTGFAEFERAGAWPALTRGADVIETFTGKKIPIGGFIDAAEDFELVPIVWASAEPGGYVAQSAFDQITDMICKAVSTSGDFDGIYLDLHGAMVTLECEDGEGELLSRIRQVVGESVPIVVSLDLHANLTPEFFDSASASAIYRTYPHVDMAETGRRAQRLLQSMLERQQTFEKAFRQLDYLIPIQVQSTMREPGRRLYGLLSELEGEEVVSVDLAFGFPPADVTHCGASLVAYGFDTSAVNQAADRLLSALRTSEGQFHNPLVPAREAVQEAMRIARSASKPVVICDPQDNPGAGATGDTTGLLNALLDESSHKAALGMLWDPDTAKQAHHTGIGGQFDASIGGRFDEFGGSPVRTRVEVEALSDGCFTFTGRMYGGVMADLGPMALLRIDQNHREIRVVVSTKRTQNADQAIFRHLGLDPTKQSIVVVKSAVHFLADYESIADRVIFAEAPGANPCQLDLIPYKRLRTGVRLGPCGPTYKHDVAG